MGGQDLEACIAVRILRGRWRLQFAVFEEGEVEGDGGAFSGIDAGEADGLFKHPAGMEEVDGKAIGIAAEEGLVFAKNDLAMVVVFEAFEEGIQILGGGLVGLESELGGKLLQRGEVGDGADGDLGGVSGRAQAGETEGATQKDAAKH
jgi:hypothetical protein